MNFSKLLQEVCTGFELSLKAYTSYLENGKTYRYAQLLMKHNRHIKELLENNNSIIPAELQNDVSAIIEHYAIWMDKWFALQQQLNPGPDDLFVFANDHRFPKESAQRIEMYRSQLH